MLPKIWTEIRTAAPEVIEACNPLTGIFLCHDKLPAHDKYTKIAVPSISLKSNDTISKLMNDRLDCFVMTVFVVVVDGIYFWSCTPYILLLQMKHDSKSTNYTGSHFYYYSFCLRSLKRLVPKAEIIIMSIQGTACDNSKAKISSFSISMRLKRCKAAIDMNFLVECRRDYSICHTII